MIKYKIGGNMLWNTVAAVPPRQVTPVEREMVTEIEFWHRQFDAISHILRAEEQNLALDLAAQKAMEAVDELARVRGLLQHYGIHKADCGTWDVTYGDRKSSELMAKACDCGLTAELSNFQPSSSLVPQGAESADIGKLDTADKSAKWLPIESAPKTGEHILVTRFDGGIGFGTCGGKQQAWAAVVHWWDAEGEQGWYLSSGNGDRSVIPTHWQEISQVAGSAETGGEEAVPQYGEIHAGCPYRSWEYDCIGVCLKCGRPDPNFHQSPSLTGSGAESSLSSPPPDPFSKGYKHGRSSKPVSDACGDDKHEECTQDWSKCNCTYRGRHMTQHAYATMPSPELLPTQLEKEKE